MKSTTWTVRSAVSAAAADIATRVALSFFSSARSSRKASAASTMPFSPKAWMNWRLRPVITI